MTPAASRLDDARRCPDGDCGAIAEPEQDGDHRYFECTHCGYGFGYARLDTLSVSSTSTCAVGIPEDIRRAASAVTERALGTQPLLTIGRRHAPDA